ncbi:translocation protein [Neolentinus lepideus HHB14362 ss-1]|uniref:Translocation protein SEC62 n=1 Tax=Neolentinus lepideus HHB14362 ss-1 TaxID=1314782 RepID=A0A165RET6_9AGAM|nr:translocation protein [Neolentinus lepideus HHB14362 ss-1]
MSATAVDQQKKAPKDLRNVVDFLRSSKSGMKIRVGVLGGKRIDYFKGKSAIKAILSPAYAKLKNVPKVTSEDEAQQLLHTVIPFAFFLRVERGQPSGSTSSSPKTLQIIREQQFKPEDYYAWFYEGSQWTTYVGAIAMVVIMLAGVMFPLWPPTFKLGVSYLSMGVIGLLGLFFAIAIVRLIFYIITIVVASPGIWIFPNLFADVGFVDSFIPVWDWDVKKSSKKKKGEKREKSEKHAANGAVIEEVADSGVDSSRPESRSARIEEVPDDS